MSRPRSTSPMRPADTEPRPGPGPVPAAPSASDLSPLPDGAAVTAALDAIFAPFDRGDAPGLVVGVAMDGRTLYRRGFGMASLEHGARNTPHTRMRIGSTSKHFTCLAALLLAERGLLDVDAPVREHLPQLPPQPVEPTLRQLMQHTSGYRCVLDLSLLAQGLATQPRGEELRLQALQPDMNFAPGTNLLYCNSGYHLLSLVIAKAAGRPFEQAMKELLFEPLGLRDTASIPSDLDIVPGLATLHVPRPAALGGGWRRGLFPSEEVLGDGAMVSTVDDMLRWLRHLRGPERRVGSPDSWAQLFTRARLANGCEARYALGLRRHAYRGVDVIHHTGGVVGGCSQMLTVPAFGLDLVLMCNGAPAQPQMLGYAIVDAVLGDRLPEARPAHARTERYPGLAGGRFHSRESGHLLRFADLEGVLGVSVMDGPPLPLIDDGAQLSVGFEGMSASPLDLPPQGLASDPAPGALHIVEWGNASVCRRLPDPSDAAHGVHVIDATHPLVGRYHSPAMQASGAIDVVDGALRLRLVAGQGGNTFTVTPWDDEVFGLQSTDPYFPNHAAMHVESRDGRGVRSLLLNTVRSRQIRMHRVDADADTDLAAGALAS